MDPNQKIWDFLAHQTVLSLATFDGHIPHAANCFYAFEQENKLLGFKSGEKTKHVRDLCFHRQVAGTILPDKPKTGRILGAQFGGTAFGESKIIGGESVREIYYHKYPYARAISGEFWIIELSLVKLTDSLLGIGKRLIWEKDPGN